ncbi:heme-binding protein 2 [Populus alba x Populus x berolinensis]|nr:heme-binding protein 2 [Populus alba x Populus x berolinensis]
MEKPNWWLLLLPSIVLLNLVGLYKVIESSQYAKVHAKPDFEVRLYVNSTWMSTPVNELSFEKATLFVFNRLFQYIQGANLNYLRIAVIVPVVTSIVPGDTKLTAEVRFYLPVKHQADLPVPLDELHLKPYAWDSHCVAVRKFSRYAKDENIAEEAKRLADSLSRSPWANLSSTESNYSYSIVQYDSPFQFIGRTNEMWADIKVSGADGCKSSGITF